MTQRPFDDISNDSSYKYLTTQNTSKYNVTLFQFLGDEETVKKAIESVAAQGKAKK